MKLLAIDTVTEACSVALWLDGEIVSQESIVNQGHTEKILPMVESVLAEAGSVLAQLDAIAFDRGPGSFTGLRIGVGVTQGLALGLDLPVIPISSLVALAQGCWRRDGHTQVFCCIDARQSEVYWAACREENGIMATLTEEQVAPVAGIRVDLPGQWFGAGTGFGRYATELARLDGVRWLGTQSESYPLARDLLPAALAAWERREFVSASDAMPVYLRNNVATPPSR